MSFKLDKPLDITVVRIEDIDITGFSVDARAGRLIVPFEFGYFDTNGKFITSLDKDGNKYHQEEFEGAEFMAVASKVVSGTMWDVNKITLYDVLIARLKAKGIIE